MQQCVKIKADLTVILPDCVVVPVLYVGAGGADGGVTVTAVEPQSLA